MSYERILTKLRVLD